jgi:2-desacetyl-2-hydroxyethyl bacteriochlorophyllide A dehydrogenase
MPHAIAFTGVNEVALREIEPLDRRPGEILVRTELSAVSPGTELRCLAGLQPDSVPFPFIPGYSLVGVVEAADPDSPVQPGQRVFASGTRRASITPQWGGQTGQAVLNAVDAFPIPEGLASEAAVLAKLVAIASRGVTLTKPTAETKVAVVGLGPIGLLSARLFQAAGAQVLAVDRIPERRDLASKGGLHTTEPEPTIAAAVQAHFQTLADVVVDATGVAAVLPDSMAAARDLPWMDRDHLDGPTLVIQGSYPGDFCLPYQSAFRKELAVRVPRDNTPKDLKNAISLLAEGKLKVTDLLTEIAPPQAAPEVYAKLRTDRTWLTAAFRWND